MTRDVDRLTARTFDLLVVGGGIYGLAIAYDAAQRGLSVALVERGDFGSGSSFNHLRTIHGGLRYLQTLDLARARESVRERRTIARIAPHTVQPLAFVLPLRRSFTAGKLAMRAGFLLDRLVASDRNTGVSPSHLLPGGRVVGRADAIEQFPGLVRQRLTGAAVWYDYVTLEPDRLTFAFAEAAAAHSAVLANYVEATALVVEGTRVRGVRARDLTTERDVEIVASLTVNATGAAVDRLLAPLGISANVPLLRAMNLVTRRDAGEAALGARAPSGRHLFLVPWRGRALFGTWESPTTVAPGSPAAWPDVAAFIAELNATFPGLDLADGDVTLVHRGIVPAAVDADGRVALQGHEQVRDHANRGVEGLMSVAGTKYTTARAVAERITTRVLAKLGLTPVACRTADVPLSGGDTGDPARAIAAIRADYDRVVPSDTTPHLVAAYGSNAGAVAEAAARDPELARRVSADSPVIGAELARAAREEMVVALADAVVRRTPLGALGFPGEEAAARAAHVVGAVLGWSEDRKREEVAALRAFYAASFGRGVAT